MAPTPPRLRILSVGGNAVSAFLSWRLQATNACDVTLVWKSGYEAVSQYGISFKSKRFGNERFKPLHVVRAPEDAAGRKAAFDYVLLCVKALPDVYDLAAVIESVVTPQHTCILLNTTHTLGVESHLEERFPTNVVLSLVSGAEVNQLGSSEFEHVGATDIWVGPANKNPAIPVSIQNDMAEALAMTLSTGQVNCKVSKNIRQQQFERMIGPIAFHPTSVLFETPSHTELIEKTGVRSMVSDIIDELLQIAYAQECEFDPDFKEKTIQSMLVPMETNSTMYQDFTMKRPMEVETYLGSPIKLAQGLNQKVPRIETLYAILHNFNILNQNRPAVAPASMPISPATSVAPVNAPPQRISSTGAPRPMMNGMSNGMGRGRTPSMGPPPPPSRRGVPSMNGFPPRAPAGFPRGPPSQISRRPSFESNDLEEFSHLVLYDDIPEGDVAPGYPEMAGINGSTSDLALRERELALRQREIQLREQEFSMRRGSRRPPPSNRGGFDDDDDDDEFFDPMNSQAPVPQIDPDNFDMMSVTSRRNRKAPSASQLRKNPEMGARGPMGGPGYRASNNFGGYRPPMGARNRASSARMMADVPGLHESLMENPMMGYSSDRYGAVDRKHISDESRAGSLTRERLAELQGTGGQPGMNGAYPAPGPGPGPGPGSSRRTSLSPGDPFNPGRRVSGRPSPPGDGYLTPNTPNMNGRPSPPGMMRQPIPRHPPGQGNAVAPHQVEQHAGVSKPYPYSRPQKNIRSLTGSASASAGSGESAQVDSENSAHSSQSSFGPRPPIGVR